MSKNSRAINEIKKALDDISGLDGRIGDITASLVPIVKALGKKNISYKDIKKFKRECERYNSL